MRATIDERTTNMRTASSMWKRAIAGLAALVGVAGWAASAHANATCGDLNGDGLPRIGDALILLQTDANPPGAATLCNNGGVLQCGDMNGDGTLTIADVVILLNFLAGNPTLFPICTGSGPLIGCTGAGDGPAGTSVLQATDHTPSWTGRHRITGSINSTQTWIAGCRYNIDGLVFVEPGITLTIQPGALIAGIPSDTGSNTSALIFKRGSKINAKGTPGAPIIMTSSAHLDTGHGSIGDWGGLTINGNAPVNCPGGECLAEGVTGILFGGPDPNDSSGVVQYVRVEFAGDVIDPFGALRNITLNGVGRRTIYDHVQANVGFDDCQAWYGGTVDGKYLVSSGCGDDLFDMQAGTQNHIQYGLGLYYEPIMQNLGNHGFEWDDNEANGSDLLPRNSPIVCNATMIGSNLQPSVGLGQTERAAALRRGTSGRITDTIEMHFRSAGLMLDDNATANQACDNGTTLHPGGLLVDHTLFFDNGVDTTGGPHPGNVQANWSRTTGTPLANCTGAQYWTMITAGGTVVPSSINTTGSTADPGVGPDPGIHVKYGLGLADSETDLNQFIPDGTQPLIGTLAGDCHAIDPFFDTTNYIGAFDPTKPTWLTTPWISFELQ
jgi:hypothetical protein